MFSLISLPDYSTDLMKEAIKKILRPIHRSFHKIDEMLHQILKTRKEIIEGNELGYDLYGDRCIEYAFVVSNIGRPPKKILDVGAAGSALTTILGALEFSVDALDLRQFPMDRYQNVNFIIGNINTISLPFLYDIVISCSTVEHIGLSERFALYENMNGDKIALEKMTDSLKNNGIMILTVPFGRPVIIKPYHRVYDKKALFNFRNVDRLKLVKEKYYIKRIEKKIWEECNEKEASNVIPTEKAPFIYALGVFVLKKSG